MPKLGNSVYKYIIEIYKILIVPHSSFSQETVFFLFQVYFCTANTTKYKTFTNVYIYGIIVFKLYYLYFSSTACLPLTCRRSLTNYMHDHGHDCTYISGLNKYMSMIRGIYGLYFIILCLTWSGIESTIFHIRFEHAYNYITESFVSKNLKVIVYTIICNINTHFPLMF
jgi:hypothetical protein